ncbi:hypothetical protein ECE18_09230, partial [Acinetobacter baumannii]|nr:hypothetical protein [Acinetobacter baumannii]
MRKKEKPILGFSQKYGFKKVGAWCETVRMKGGDLPDGLHINQIYWLMREAGKEVQKSKSYIR